MRSHWEHREDKKVNNKQKKMLLTSSESRQNLSNTLYSLSFLQIVLSLVSS